MARKPWGSKFEEGIFWLEAPVAAKAAGVSKPELARMASEGLIRSTENAYGMPWWFAEPDIDALRKARIEKERTKASSKKRPKSARQLEREWAKMSEANAEARPRRDGPFVDLHLKLTVRRDKKDE